jgi:integrase/recombinase XerD
MFAFNTVGMRASDIITLKWANIQNGRIIYQMLKTGKIHSMKLPDKAKKILSNYGPKKPGEYVFPFFSSDTYYADAMFLHNKISAKTALINKYLKLIAAKAEINKKIL